MVFSSPPQSNKAQLTALDSQSSASGSNELQLTPPEEKELISQLKEGMKRMPLVIGRHVVNLEVRESSSVAWLSGWGHFCNSFPCCPWLQTLVGSGLLLGDNLKALEEEIMEYGRKTGVKFMAEARYALSPDHLSFL